MLTAKRALAFLKNAGELDNSDVLEMARFSPRNQGIGGDPVRLLSTSSGNQAADTQPQQTATNPVNPETSPSGVYGNGDIGVENHQQTPTAAPQGSHEVRGTIVKPPAGSEQKPAQSEPTAPVEPDKLPTVDSIVPGQTVVNPDMSAFPNVKRSYWKDGKLILVVDKLPERSWTQNETSYHARKYGPYVMAAVKGAAGVKAGVAAGKNAGPYGAAASAIIGGAAGVYSGWRMGPYEAEELIKAWDPKTTVSRYGDIIFEEE